MSKKVLLFAALACIAGCVTTGPVSTDADIAAIKQNFVEYVGAVEKGDSAAWLALWDQGGIQMPPNAPAKTKEQLDAGAPKSFKARVDAGTEVKMVITTEEVIVTGPWAYARGVYTQDFDNKSTGAKSRIDGKFLTVYKRQADGSWRIYRDCFNSNVPPG
jgi:ketosteroid isomerase-like protein